MPLQTELADRLVAAGLDVVEVDGWERRGSSSFNPGGVVCHHTADGAGEIPSLRVLIHGRSDLPGPLCQIGLARSGACYVVAAGRANHAGRGGWKGMVGNSSVWGIEAENRGGAGDPWPEAQMEAYVVLAAVLQDYSARPTDASYVCGHKEWAPGRKPDPHTVDMNAFREVVAAILKGDIVLVNAKSLKTLEGRTSIEVIKDGKKQPLGIDHFIKAMAKNPGKVLLGPNNEWLGG